MKRHLSTIFQCSIYVNSALFLFTFLVLPAHSVYSRLSLNQAFIEKYRWVFVSFSLWGTVVSYLFSRFFLAAELRNVSVQQPNQESTFSGSQPKAVTLRPPHDLSQVDSPRWKLPLFIGIGGILLVRAIIGIERPFDMDELAGVEGLLNGEPWGNLLYEATHPISSLASKMSAKLFGVSLWSLRLPSVLLCIVFLILFIRFCQANFSPLSGALALGHLASNSIFVWYFHSTRGYALMIVLVFWLFNFLFDIAVKARNPTPMGWISFGTTLLLLPFCHGFAILFGVLLPISTSAWIHFNHNSLPEPQRRNIFKANTILLAFLPYLALCLGYMFSLQATLGNKYIGMDPNSPMAKEDIAFAVAGVLGASHDLSLKVLFLAVVFVVFQLIRRNRLFKDISFHILIIFMGFVTMQSLLLKSHMLGRFLLGMLPLFVVWIFYSGQDLLEKYSKRILLTALFVALIFFPVIDGRPSLFQLPQEDFYDFLQTARKELKGTHRNCIDFSHSGAQPAPVEAWFAKVFYFRTVEPTIGAPQLAQVVPEFIGQCTKRYQLHFSWPWQQDPSYSEQDKQIGSFKDLPKGQKYQLIHTDGNGRFLAVIGSK